MTNEELCERIQAGESDLLAQLLEQNNGMIHKVAARYLPFTERQCGVEFEDLTQTASLGMLLAVHGWDINRGSFLTYAVLVMQKEVRDLVGIRSTKRRIEDVRRVLPLNESTNPDDSEGITIEEKIADVAALDPLTACVEKDIRERLYKAINLLPDAIRISILRAYFYGGVWTQDKSERSRVLNGIDRLKRNKDLKQLRREFRLSYYRHKGVKAFNSSWSSTVEDAVLRLELLCEERERMISKTMKYLAQLRN